MRVLHINSNYITTMLHQLMIRQLSTLGIDNQVFVPTFDKHTSTIVPDDNVKVVECFKKRDRYWFDYKQKKIIKAAEESFDIKSFDLIHAYTLFTDGNCARYLSKKYGIPYVVAVRNTDVNLFFKYRILLRKQGIRILQDAGAVFFLSPAYREYLLQEYVPDALKESVFVKTHIIPNGIDDFWFQNKFTNRNSNAIEERLEQKELRLVYVGNVDKNKNIKLTVDAMEQLNRDGWKVTLKVIGPITEESVYNEIKDNPNVQYIKRQPKEELIKCYRESDIFVMPSHHETFGLVYAEAMSQGLPVIYTRGQGFDGHFEDGKVGLPTSDTDAKVLAKTIQSIAEGYLPIAHNCIKYCHCFRWSAIVETYQGIYKQVQRNR